MIIIFYLILIFIVLKNCKEKGIPCSSSSIDNNIPDVNNDCSSNNKLITIQTLSKYKNQEQSSSTTCKFILFFNIYIKI